VDGLMLQVIDRSSHHNRIEALPPERPLLMPAQSLRRSEKAVRPNTGPRWAALRRLLVFGVAIAMTMRAAYEMYLVLEVGGLTIPEGLVLGLFVLLFAWIALSFVSTLAGFVATILGLGRTLEIDPSGPLPALSSRTALLVPTYNENPQHLMARLQAIHESVQATGHGGHFDFYVISDTTDPEIWVEEEAEFLRLRERTGAGRIFYRHRTKNTARKAGNVAEWISRFGGNYDFMLVLDADSLIVGDTVVRLAGAMERHPGTGLIQTLPVLVNGNTLFARIQQFSGRVYGPLIARGIAWWHGAESNYWGHNAIIRVRAFADHAGLPELSGRKPFGGHILSHDFVEAALLRRAGWGIHLAPSLGGSYEECPPTLTDYAARDRRWCQGNLQHLGVLLARGLHWVSRLHLLTGIGSYITAPMWLVFLLAGILISLQAQFIRPEYFPSGASLFPRWPAQDPVRAAWVFAGTMALLVAPKLLGYLTMLFRAHARRSIGGGFRGFTSVLLETFVSALIAPIMMLMQSKAVAEILIGRDAGWETQQREDGRFPAGEIVRRYAGHTALGLALAIGAAMVSWPLFFWMTPVLIGLALAIPIALVTSSAGIGRRLRKARLLLTPEEHAPPAIALRTNEIIAETKRTNAIDAVEHLAKHSALREFHLATLVTPTRRRGDIDVDLVIARAKIDEAEDCREAVGLLSRKELFAVLANRDALLALLAKERTPKPGVAVQPREKPIGEAPALSGEYT
jgi:membrane glycosyltransferase